MTQPLEIVNIRAEDITEAGSRYRNQNVIYYGEKRYITFDTYLRRPYQRTGDEKVMVITKGLEYRPDLASYDFYGFPENWWRILEVNGMSDVIEFKAGKTIFFPNISV